MKPRPHIKCVVFDFDGTLVKSNDIKKGEFFAIARFYPGGEAQMSAILEEPKPGDRYQVLASFRRRMISLGATFMPSCDDLAEKYSVEVEKKILAADEIPGALDVLRNLKNMNIPAYLNSATPVGALIKIINQSKFSGYFKGIFGSPLSKAGAINLVLKNENLSSCNVLMVGDNIDDQKAALETGANFLGIRNSYSNFDPTPDLVTEDFLKFGSSFDFNPNVDGRESL